MNLKFKSTAADLSFKSVLDKLEIMNQNIIYITYSTDKCLALLKELKTDTGLQKQVDDYFEGDPFASDLKTAEQIKKEDGLSSSN